jgi:hypothetical protein
MGAGQAWFPKRVNNSPQESGRGWTLDGQLILLVVAAFLNSKLLFGKATVITTWLLGCHSSTITS